MLSVVLTDRYTNWRRSRSRRSYKWGSTVAEWLGLGLLSKGPGVRTWVSPLPFQRLSISCFYVAIWLKDCKSDVKSPKQPQNNKCKYRPLQDGYIILKAGGISSMDITVVSGNEPSSVIFCQKLLFHFQIECIRPSFVPDHNASQSR